MVTELTGRRLGIIAFLAVALFATLIARLWFLQVMSAPQFQETAASNRTRDIFVEAPRGRILDAQGRVLAGRRESLVVTLDWNALNEISSEERESIAMAVADELNLAGIKTKADGLLDAFTAARDGSLKPVVVAEDVDQDTWIAIQERAFTGFAVERRWVRTYPYGNVGAHVIGYTRTVASAELADELNRDNEDRFYLPGDEIGATGIERLLERTLRGVPEKRRVEVDAQNRIIRTAEVLQEGVPGQDVHLTLDIDVQYAAEQILVDELLLARRREACKGCLPHRAEAGSLVALDVNDGSVMALASVPTYDPTDFIFGISANQFAFLRDRPDQPLFDRATRGLYAPGSTFKHVTAYSALITGIRSENQIWNDEGVYEIDDCTAGCSFQNAGRAVLGPVDLRASIERSSDTYYYAVGAEMWDNRGLLGETPMQDSALAFGFGQPTGIRLPDEATGRIPTPANRIEEFGEDSRPWSTGDNVNLSIGQGDVLVTPLQLANSYAMVATGGVRYQPRLIDRATTADGEIATEFPVIASREEQLDPTALNAIRDGLFRVNRTGTAAEAFAGFPLDNFPIAGKTGTAQVNDKADFSLYAGFGPGLAPQYAVAAVLEEAGFGGDAAAPAVRRMFEILLGVQPIQPAPLAGEDRIPYERSTTAVDEPVDDQSVAEPVDADEPVVDEPVVDEPVVDESGEET